MLTWKRSAWVIAFELAGGAAFGQSHHHHHGGPGGGWGLGAVAGASVGLGGGYFFPFYSSVGLDGIPFTYTPPVVFPMSMAPSLGPIANPPPAVDQRWGLAGPLPGFDKDQRPRPAQGEAMPRKADPCRSGHLVTIGDRLLRADDLHRAAERYEQALNADPTAAVPRVRLAQVALARGQYAEAANRIREAMTAEPGWLINAPDIQSIYGEPSDFARLIAKLESHVQAHPNDRDAWFLLGAQWYLSGQSRKASDVFLRLSDRRGDPALTAFLDASRPRHPDPQ